MDNNLYQNIDVPLKNPLEQKVKKNKISFPKDPKIRLLIILVIVLVILLLTALFFSIFRQKQKPSSLPTPTPTPTIKIIPTTSQSIVPTQFIEKFTTIDQQIKTPENFLPPQIDTNIGL